MLAGADSELTESSSTSMPAAVAHGGAEDVTAGVRRGVSVCVINYNGAAYLEHSLTALLRDGVAGAEILVVDNGSTDGSPALIEERFPSVGLVRMTTNLGPGGARNEALRRAADDVVVLIDNDVTPEPGAIERLLTALERTPDAVMAMPAIVYAADGTIVQYDGADTHFLGQQTLHHQDVPYAEIPREQRDIGSLVSACLVVDRPRLLAAVGGGEVFDEDFFIYFEDHDLGHRMRLQGLRILSVPAAACRHGLGTEGLSIRAIGGYSPRRVYYHIRNRWFFIAKNYSVHSLAVLTPMLIGYEVLQLAGVVKKGWLKQWLRAVGWMATHARLVLRKRRIVQRRRRLSDRLLLRGGPVPLREEATSSGVERRAKRILDAASAGYWRIARELL